MNANLYNTRDYERKRNWTLSENKPNLSQFMPIKANSNPISEKPKMNVNLSLTKDYRKKDDFTVRKNKPNLSRRSLWRSRIQTQLPKG